MDDLQRNWPVSDTDGEGELSRFGAFDTEPRWPQTGDDVMFLKFVIVVQEVTDREGCAGWRIKVAGNRKYRRLEEVHVVHCFIWKDWVFLGVAVKGQVASLEVAWENTDGEGCKEKSRL